MPQGSNEVVHIPFHGDEILAIDVDGKPYVVVKPAVEAIGLDYWAQIRKLRERSWATTASKAVVAADGKVRDMVTCDVRTFLMLLATIDENRVAADVKDKLVAYQAEVADAIEAYWTQGGALNPRATRQQLDEIAESAERRIRMLGAAKGLVDDRWLEAMAREQLAIGLGREPEQDPATRFLTVAEYLEEQGVSGSEVRKLSPTFGKRLKLAYVARRGEPPGKSLRFVDGAQREVFVYTEADRDLFDAVWAEFNDDLVTT
ncbi:hypothetical protein Sme01_02690 [Sphaerisporangium melleum]|uniref:Antirepressor protein ant N-terminal domain-containing protein n=1 Tax=Sphaerisporangium melleum TaxID=321316 RepID=A0A917QNW1_9ACTN|nr:phage antirepressor N-terminal domain-containing protein [Sphaerisporangium melleum]GGK61067.1 hypothetical protein GCM10007964_00230 [Sphaerisporangium melleum]GII67793.1 hypothetical protein Sme01_02690 [Sphaerisporangium melleum]